MINFNGNIVESPTFTADNRGVLYGDGVFETMRYSGDKIYFWEEHYLRLMASMRIMRMDIPMGFTMEKLEEEVIKCLTANGLAQASARVRLTVYRNDGGTYLPQDNGVGYFISAKALQNPFFTLDDETYEVELYKDHYLSADLLSTIKSTNRLINITGSIFADENGYQNCLLLNNNKMVVEALNGNVFLVKGNTLKTPPLADGCLRGIIRKQVLDILGKVEDFEVEEASISPFELQKADEVFITNSILGIRPVTKYRKKSFNTGVARKLLGMLNAKARLG
ncbi:MAG: aminotransferase class IV [Cytophagaceae bacterium]|nr:aminotransferase class IV [Cytophagaceae bacterium]|tara:strand:+ start:426 stop:1265 length:840 start_codon:yes stop_codon:yes gene_type:complete